MSVATTGIAHSIQTRLVQHAKATGTDSNLVLTRFAVERFLYRLSQSPHADRFVLKGALLLLVWLGETIRPTRDADLLGFGELSERTLAGILADVCSIKVEPDGMSYLPSSVRVRAIRAEDAYGGWRGTIQARLGNARLHVQIDVGIGDAVTPEPEWVDYPGLLDFARARIRAYRPETAIAEKLHAMVVLGAANSRMRDFFDVYLLSERGSFESALLAAAIRATFERRRTALPNALPLALTTDFSALEGKQSQWQGFLRKNALTSAPANLADTVERLAIFLEPVLDRARAQNPTSLALIWPASGPWKAIV